MKPWPKVRLGETCRMVKGTSPTMRTEPGPYPLVVTAEFRRTADTWQLEGPAVCIPLVSSTGHGDAALHRVHYQEGKFALANLLVALLPNDPKVCYAKYLYHLLMARKDELLVSLMQGTANVSLKEKDIAGVEIPLPALAEQRRVVARIEALAAQIHEARTLRHQAAEEAEALRSAGRNTFFASTAKEFGASRLEELSSRITKGESPEWQGFTYQDSGPLFIRSENVLWGRLDPRNAVRIPQAFHKKLSRCQLRKDDVLINLVGASIGRACSVPGDLGDANVNQAVGVISPDTDRLRPDFLVHYLLSPIAQDKIHGGKVETARPNISLGDVRDLQIPTPPLAEQRRIVAELDALQAEVDALKRLQAETAAELAALLPAPLDRAFKGEL